MHSLLYDLFPEVTASDLAQAERDELSLSWAPDTSVDDAWPDYGNLIYTQPPCAAPEATLILPDPTMLAPWSIPLPQSAETLPRVKSEAIPRVKSEKAESETMDTTVSEVETAQCGAAQGAWTESAPLAHSQSLSASESQSPSQLQSQALLQSQSQSQSELVPVLVDTAEGGQLFKSPPRRGRKFKGVRHRKWGKFVCEIRDAMGERIWLGSFDKEEDAARVYDMAARILQGPGAWLNFPHEAPGPITLPRGTLEQLIKHRSNTTQRLKENEEKKVQKRAAAALASATAASSGVSEAQPCKKQCSDSTYPALHTPGVPNSNALDAALPWVDLAGWLDECEKEGSLGWAAVCSELLGPDADDVPQQQDACQHLQRSQSDQCSSTSMYSIFQGVR